MSHCTISVGQMAEWARQQQDMAKQVITTDGVPWHLNADRPTERLTRVGGLDISFLEPQSCPRGQQHSPFARNAVPATAVNMAATEMALTAATTTTTTNTGTSPSSSSLVVIRESEPGASAGAVSSSGAQPTQWWVGQRDPAQDDEDSERSSVSCGPGVAALVVLSFPDMRVLYEDFEPVDLSIPYLPGYLGFRECDAYGRLLKRVQASANQPQVLLVDGCGVLHPRRCGSACQVGVMSGYPTVGISKNLLAVDGLDRFAVRRQLQEATEAAATAAKVKPTTASSSQAAKQASATLATAVSVRDVQVPLVGLSGAVHGIALCPVLSKRPLYISVGHRLSILTAVELVRQCCVHRVPEPIRQADLRSRQWLRDHYF